MNNSDFTQLASDGKQCSAFVSGDAHALDSLKTMRKVLMDGINSASLGMEGFQRLEALLVAIQRFYALDPSNPIVTIAKESEQIASDFSNMMDVERENFQRAWNAAGGEVSHG